MIKNQNQFHSTQQYSLIFFSIFPSAFPNFRFVFSCFRSTQHNRNNRSRLEMLSGKMNWTIIFVRAKIHFKFNYVWCNHFDPVLDEHLANKNKNLVLIQFFLFFFSIVICFVSHRRVRQDKISCSVDTRICWQTADCIVL